MASQPVKRATIAKLADLARVDQPDLPDSLSTDDLALAYLCAYMANGGRLSALAKSLGVSRWLLDLWTRETPERRESYSRARTLGADALVDEGGDLLDAATRDTIAVANARAGWRKWLAGKYDPTNYGDAQAPQVSIGSLHLHALQSPRPLPLLDTKPPLVGSLEPVGERGYRTATRADLPVGRGNVLGHTPTEIVIEPPPSLESEG